MSISKWPMPSLGVCKRVANSSLKSADLVNATWSSATKKWKTRATRMVTCPPTVLVMRTLMAACTGTTTPMESSTTDLRKDVSSSKLGVANRHVKRNSLVTVQALSVFSSKVEATLCATAERSLMFQATQCPSKFTVPDRSRLIAEM